MISKLKLKQSARGDLACMPGMRRREDCATLEGAEEISYLALSQPACILEVDSDYKTTRPRKGSLVVGKAP
jgi:hypothetical protein